MKNMKKEKQNSLVYGLPNEWRRQCSKFFPFYFEYLYSSVHTWYFVYNIYYIYEIKNSSL